MTVDREEIIVLKLRTEEMEKKLIEVKSSEKECALSVRKDIKELEQTFTNRLDKTDKKLDLTVKDLSDTFVTIERFKPIELIIYGLVSLILVSFVSALIVLVMKQ